MAQGRGTKKEASRKGDSQAQASRAEPVSTPSMEVKGQGERLGKN